MSLRLTVGLLVGILVILLEAALGPSGLFCPDILRQSWAVVATSLNVSTMIVFFVQIFRNSLAHR